jgi:hypothetical protein
MIWLLQNKLPRFFWQKGFLKNFVLVKSIGIYKLVPLFCEANILQAYVFKILPNIFLSYRIKKGDIMSPFIFKKIEIPKPGYLPQNSFLLKPFFNVFSMTLSSWEHPYKTFLVLNCFFCMCWSLLTLYENLVW